MLRNLLRASLAFAVLLAAPAAASADRYVSTAEITVPGLGKASPYPSTIDVGGTRGPVTGITVTLDAVSHKYSNDLDIFLASPRGEVVALASDVCGTTVVAQTWTFVAASDAPAMSGSCSTSTYRPTNNNDGTDDVAVTGTDLSVFAGDDPTGTWALHVIDDTSGGTGKIAGWSLEIETAPVAALIPGIGTVGIASPYPARHTVSDGIGVITDLNVLVPGLSHRRPNDVDMLLVGPHGEKTVLMSDACGTGPVEALDLRFDDEAPAALPITACSPVSYRPGNIGEAEESLPAPAPSAPYAKSLSAFDLTDPAGEWRLYLADDLADYDGFLAGSGSLPFALDITTRPKARVSFDAARVEAAEGQLTEVSLTRGGPDEVGAGAVRLSTEPASAAAGTDFDGFSTVVEFAPGETKKTVPVLALPDADGEPEEAFLLRLTEAGGDAAIDTPSVVVATIPGQVPAGDGGPGNGPSGGGPSGPGGGTTGPGGTPPPKPRCAGKPATIVGTSGRDVLRGTKRADVIVALGGNDRITGTGGNDLVCAGAGNDTVAGGSGNDRLFGDAGRDRLDGGSGRDRLTGGVGRDTCTGISKNDKASCERRRAA